MALAGTAAILLLGPWRDTFDFGQINIILMGLILADFALYGKSRAGEIRWPAGLLIGIAAGIKLTPLAFGLYFLVRRDFKALGWMAAGFFGSIAVAWAVLPTASVTFWTRILPDTGRIGGPAYVDNLSVKGLLLHLGLPDSGFTSLLWLVLSLALVALAALVIKWAVAVDENFVAVSATAVLMLLISPVSWSHHWVWMAVALPSMAFAMHRVPSRNGRMRLVGWVIVAFSAVAFYLTPKDLAVMAGAAEWGEDPQTQWQLIVASLGVLCGIAMLGYWARPTGRPGPRSAGDVAPGYPARPGPRVCISRQCFREHCREMTSGRRVWLSSRESGSLAVWHSALTGPSATAAWPAAWTSSATPGACWCSGRSSSATAASTP